MKITVEHEIPCDKGKEQTYLYAGDFWGNPVCRYHTHRNRTHGRKAPMEKNVPKCTLFDEWLSRGQRFDPAYLHHRNPVISTVTGFCLF